MSSFHNILSGNGKKKVFSLLWQKLQPPACNRAVLRLPVVSEAEVFSRVRVLRFTSQPPYFQNVNVLLWTLERVTSCFPADVKGKDQLQSQRPCCCGLHGNGFASQLMGQKALNLSQCCKRRTHSLLWDSKTSYVLTEQDFPKKWFIQNVVDLSEICRHNELDLLILRDY